MVRFYKDNLKNTKSCCLKIVQEVDSLKVLAFSIERDWFNVSIILMNTWSQNLKLELYIQYVADNRITTMDIYLHNHPKIIVFTFKTP